MSVSGFMLAALIYLLYFLSGASALVYELVWTRAVTHSLGSSVLAVSTVTGLFLGGLAVGSARGAHWIPASEHGGEVFRGCVKRFALMQLIVAVFAVVVPLLFAAPTQNAIWNAAGISDARLSYFERVLFATLVIVPPAVAMGVTFPVIIAAAGKLATRAAERLYAVNTFGAAVGSLLAGFVLLPGFGLQLSSTIGGLIDLVVAGTAFYVLGRASIGGSDTERAAPGVAATKRKKAKNAAPIKGLFVASAVAGFLALSSQVCWVRLFALLIGSSTYSLSCVLAVFLFAMAVGALLVVKLPQKWNQPLVIAAGLVFVGSLYLCGMLYVMNDLPWTFITLERTFSGNFAHANFAALMAARLTLVSAIVFVPALCLGAVLPLLFAAIEAENSGPAPAATGAGHLYAWNAVGCIIGAFSTGFVLIPQLAQSTTSGMQTTLLLMSLVGLLLAWWLFFLWGKSWVDDKATQALINGIVGFVVIAVIADIAFMRPSWDTALMSSGPSFYGPAEIERATKHEFESSISGSDVTDKPQMLFYQEGLNNTISVQSSGSQQNTIFLRSDGKVEAALPADFDKPAPGSDMATHVALGSLPVLLHQGPCSNVLVIGYGSGTTSGALLHFPEISKLRIAELEKAVYNAALVFAKHNGVDRKGATVNVIPEVNDGRFIMAASDEAYDAIVCQPSDPWVNGSSELYSQEFWQLMRSRLKPGGVACQWIPLYSITPEYFGVLCRTFNSAFENAFVFHQPDAGECILIGMKAQPVMPSLLPFPHDRLPPANPGFQLPADFATRLKLRTGGIKRMCDRLAAVTHDARVNTDDNLVVEFAAAANVITQKQRIKENIDWIENSAP